MTLAPGTRLGPYEVIAPLGAGGMGEVYKARDTRLGRTVAIKVLAAGVAADPGPSASSGSSRVQSRDERHRRFEQEARAVSSLNHPHICVLYDIGSQDGVDFLVMEHLEGQTLKARLESARLPIREAVDLGMEVADALEAAHARGIVHRDLKPANIFLTRRGQAKLLDFGVAKLAADQPAADTEAETKGGAWATGAGVTLGTVGYMSPEQVRGEMVDARTDLFSLGVVLYEMLTGTAPFRGATSGVVLGEILTKAPTAPVKLNPDVPPDLERLLNKLLEKDRALRYQSAADLSADFRRLERSLASPAPATAARSSRASIVVLPFANISSDFALVQRFNCASRVCAAERDSCPSTYTTRTGRRAAVYFAPRPVLWVTSRAVTSFVEPV